jgi:hypothetical protein
MTSRERLLAVLRGERADRIPGFAWCGGLTPPPALRWETLGHPVMHWWTRRFEHTRTLAREWLLEDDFQRVRAWLKLGLDDALDVSVPWSQSPAVRHEDFFFPLGQRDPEHPVLQREYRTSAGLLRHAVRQPEADPEAGGNFQPDHVPLIDEHNLPLVLEPLVTRPEHVAALRMLFQPPDREAREHFTELMGEVASFARQTGVPVFAWSAFGLDAAVWFAGRTGAVRLAQEHPRAFEQLMETIRDTDRARTELACETPGADVLALRGWHSGPDLWPPALFDRFLLPQVRELAGIAHRRGKALACVVPAGLELLGPRLADAGLDLLYFADPADLDLEKARELLGGRIALAGGVSMRTMTSADATVVRNEVRRAVETFGRAGRFVLQPAGLLTPGTPWANVEAFISARRAMDG